MPEHKVEKHAPPPQTAFLISWQSDAIWYGRNSGWRYKSATGLLHITRIHIYLYFNLFSQALPRLNQGNFKSGFQSKRHIHDCLTLPPPAVKRRQLDFSRKQDGRRKSFQMCKGTILVFLLLVDLDVNWVPMHLAHF